MTTPTRARSDRHRVWGRVAVGLTTVAVAGGFNASAAAGGWAVSTLDEMPAAVAGEAVEVGFTIRQHGVTPVAIDDVGIEVRSPDGLTSSFEAAAGGPVGHYVATVVFPAAGEYSWAVRQGFFGDHELGAIDVGERSTVPTERRWSHTWQYGLPVGAALLAAVAAFDAMVARRRRALSM